MYIAPFDARDSGKVVTSGKKKEASSNDNNRSDILSLFIH